MTTPSNESLERDKAAAANNNNAAASTSNGNSNTSATSNSDANATAAAKQSARPARLLEKDEEGTIIEMPVSRHQFEENLANALRRDPDRLKVVINRATLAAMNEVTEVYHGHSREIIDCDKRSMIACKRFQKLGNAEGVDFRCSWDCFLKRLKNVYTIREGKLCHNNKEILSLDDYYSHILQMVKERFEGKLDSSENSREALKTLMTAKYTLNAKLLGEGLHPPPSKSIYLPKQRRSISLSSRDNVQGGAPGQQHTNLVPVANSPYNGYRDLVSQGKSIHIQIGCTNTTIHNINSTKNHFIHGNIHSPVRRNSI